MADEQQPMSPTPPTLPVQVESQPAPSAVPEVRQGASFSWQASEFIHHQKTSLWYLVLGVVVLALIGVAVLTHQWFSIAVFIVMAVAVVVYATKEPRILTYRIDDTGITINDKLTPFSNFKSYTVLDDLGWHMIDMEPTQRFMPRVSIIFDSANIDAITGLLSAKLPRVDRQPDWIERLTRSLRF